MSKTIIAFLIAFSLLFTACGTDSAHYAKEDIIEKCGFSKSAYDETELVGIKCTEVSSFRSKEKTEYDGLCFYIFDSEADAKKAFAKTEDWFMTLDDSGDNFRQGYLAGVCDAEIIEYEYLSGNMIIFTDLAVISCWGTAEEFASYPGPDYEAMQNTIDLINREF